MKHFTQYPKSVTAARSSSAYHPKGSLSREVPAGREIEDDSRFNEWQKEQIRLGLESGIDVSIYADPKFYSTQMYEIRQGLTSGLDVSIYADPKFDYAQMEEIRRGLASGVDVNLYADPRFNWKQMQKIRHGLDKYSDDPLINEITIKQLLNAYRQNSPTLEDYLLSTYQRSKDRWSAVKDAVTSRQPVDIPAIEEEFNLMTLEGSAANKLSLSFEENSDGSISFFKGETEIANLSSTEYDELVKSAIANSSTRSSFAKAFTVRLKRALNLV